MSNQVRVENLEVFALFRAALMKFAQVADNSLCAADSDISRVRYWLEGEQATHWQNQLRKRTEMVAQARDAVRQKKLFKDAAGRTPSAVEEEKHLARCVAALEEAHRKIENVRRWIPRLDKASDQYRGGVSRLNTTVTVDVPRAVALLDRLAGSLEQYVQLESTAASDGFETSAAGRESMARAEGEATPLPPPAPPAENAAPAGGQEGKHVADGR